MLTLDSNLTLDKETIESKNLCGEFGEVDLRRIGEWVYDGYLRDKQSRAAWERRTSAAMDLAMQITEAKNFPWPNCSNVAFPLITIGVMQFHARAYPAIITGPDIVKYRVIGEDPEGRQKKRADRIGSHMSWQILEQDEGWEDGHDRLIINLSVVGCNFKKSHYNGRHNKSELVMAKDLVLDYYAKSVESCPRKTHCIPLFRNEIYERVQRGIFRDILDDSWYKSPQQPTPTPAQQQSDNRHGVIPPAQPDETTPFICLEQHCDLDLDGDGYAEPYIISIEEQSHAPLRIVTRFDRLEDIERTKGGKIISIRALEYFTKYSFIPSPDGGIYDVGFGVLLGPLNESTNSLINQLIDAGTISTTGGGFLGRGAKVRGGVYTFAPLEWKRVDSTGDDLRKSIFPLPVREPSAVLFNLLTLLINYTSRVSGTTDMMVGENPGQNTPAETSRTMVEQGMKIYNAIFKRVWRSMKEEFKKLYILNGIYLPEVSIFGSGAAIQRTDYLGDPSKLVPIADPNVTSESAQFNQATTIKQAAMSTPGYDPVEVERRFLKALRVDGVETLYPGPEKFPPPPDIKIQLEQLKLQGKQMELQQEMQQFVMTLQEEQRMNSAKIMELQADATEAISRIDTTRTAQQVEIHKGQVEMFKGQIELLKSRNDLIGKHMDAVKKMIDVKIADTKASAASKKEASA